MQYVDGLDVLGLMRECARAQIRLPPHLAAFIAREILDALDFARLDESLNAVELSVPGADDDAVDGMFVEHLSETLGRSLVQV